MKDFFISYNGADKNWAEWIAWVLEEAGYSVIIRAWDFRPGGNFVLYMHRAASETHQTIVVLSENYLNSVYTQPEWAAAFVEDPKGEKRKFIPIRVRECQTTGLLAAIVYTDLVGLSEQDAHIALLGSFSARAKPDMPPKFPGESVVEPVRERVTPDEVPYPGSPRTVAGGNDVFDKSQRASRLSRMKIRSLEERLSNLLKAYEAANNQITATLNQADHIRLKNQIVFLEKEIQQVENEISALR
jgi:hypothetical protein